MLAWIKLYKIQDFACFQRRKQPVFLFFFFIFLINNTESGKNLLRALRFKNTSAGLYINAYCIEYSRGHLAGYKTVPYKRVELVLVQGKKFFYAVRLS